MPRSGATARDSRTSRRRQEAEAIRQPPIPPTPDAQQLPDTLEEMQRENPDGHVSDK